MMKDKVLQSYEQLAKGYNDLIDHKPHNAYYDRPATLQLMGEVAGLRIFDAACGPGKYAEELMDKGADVVGCDLSPRMIEYAQTRNGDKGHFFVHDMAQPFDMLEDQSFDMVICALALHYLEKWDQTIQDFYRLLKPQGVFVASVEHPFFEHLYYKSGQYFEVEPVSLTWKGFGQPVEMHSFRRSLGDCIAPITNNGFYIDQLIEPRPVAEFELRDPKHFRELNEFPAFMHIRAIRRD